MALGKTSDFNITSLKQLTKDFLDSRGQIKSIKEQYDFNKLQKVRISGRDGSFAKFVKLQTPQQLGVWGDTAFVTSLNPDVNFSINSPNPWVPLKKDIEKNWLLHIEPPGYVKKLSMDAPGIVNKFGRVYTSAPYLYEQGGRYIASPPYVQWYLARSSYTFNPDNMVYDYDFLKSYVGIPEKEYSLATINSKVNALPGHKVRADFISKISESGLDYGLYGTDNWAVYKQYKGSTVNGKWPIYSKSRYVLAIENEISDYYWTEKFTDAILCFSMPIYFGSPKINNYFPEGSYIPLDITKKSAVDDLREILKSDYFEKNISSLLEARKIILEKRNMFNFIDAELHNRAL